MTSLQRRELVKPRSPARLLGAVGATPTTAARYIGSARCRGGTVRRDSPNAACVVLLEAGGDPRTSEAQPAEAVFRHDADDYDVRPFTACDGDAESEGFRGPDYADSSQPRESKYIDNCRWPTGRRCSTRARGDRGAPPTTR